MQHAPLAPLEAIGRGIVDRFYGETAEAHVYGTVKMIRSLDHSPRFDVVRRTHDRHARDHAHERQILQALMRSTVLADRNACVRRADLHVEMRIADRVSDLLIGASGCKHRERARKRHLARQRKPRRDAHHIGLGDAAVDMALGESLFEEPRFRRCRQIRVEHDEIVAAFPELHESLPIAFARGDFLQLRHSASPSRSNSVIAARYCSSFGALPCHETSFSMKETPLPFTLFKMMAVGFPAVCRASSNARCRAAKS